MTKQKAIHDLTQFIRTYGKTEGEAVYNFHQAATQVYESVAEVARQNQSGVEESLWDVVKLSITHYYNSSTETFVTAHPTSVAGVLVNHFLAAFARTDTNEKRQLQDVHNALEQSFEKANRLLAASGSFCFAELSKIVRLMEGVLSAFI